MVLVYGDTNSTLAGALAASKLLVPVAHVEAGLRSYNMQMPEEQNRVLTDHISKLLFCPTGKAVENLIAEGVTKNVFNVGDVMCDALLHYKAAAAQKYGETGTGELKHLLPRPGVTDRWYLATIHRAENTDGTQNLRNILEALRQLGAPVVFPVHPRIKRPVEELSRSHDYASIHFVEPVGYLQMIRLISGAKGVITDSGGLQKEAYLLGVPCVTVREQTEWVETLAGGWNRLAKAETADILEKALQAPPLRETRGDYYGDGHAAEKICGIIGEGG
jgi:UDP-N-acetylglucosamine 2-epimerase (non-hydrolysing)/UDP-GlcNAc3NAcA epimerase